MRSIATCLVLVAFGNAPTSAQEAQNRRILAERLSLDADASNSIHATIWADKLPGIISVTRQNIARLPRSNLKLETEVLSASFTDGDRQIIVSAITPECKGTDPRPEVTACLLRIVEVRAGKIRTIREVQDFPFAGFTSDSRARGWAPTNGNPNFAVFLVFNPVTKQLTTKMTYAGKNAGVDDKIRTISIN